MEKQLIIVRILIAAVAVSQTAARSSGTAPTDVTASPWPYTALVFFTSPDVPPGKSITSYTASGMTAPWIHGSASTSPIMVQGGDAGWNGNANSFSVVANFSDGTRSQASGPSNTVLTSAGSSPTTSRNVYVGGVFNWQGDYDFGGAMDYADVTGNPSARYDLKWCTPAGNQGGWLPFAPQNTYDLKPYKYMNLDLKPTTAGKTWDIYFAQIGDVTVNASAVIDARATYGPAPQPGVWATYKIPLAAMGVGPGAITTVYKFALHDHAQIGANCWYAQNVYFSAN
jgi:hypothetical protein